MNAQRLGVFSKRDRPAAARGGAQGSAPPAVSQAFQRSRLRHLSTQT